MKRIAVFLDRDGVINVEKDYLYKIEDFEFIEKSIDAMRMIKEKGYMLVVVTNQSGIARGFYTEQDFQQLTEWMDWSLQDQGILLDGIYYCPHHPEAKISKYKCDCNCRKPKPGMILDSAKELGIDLEKSIMVGDKISDVESGIAAGIQRNYLVRTGHEFSKENEEKATKVYENLYELAKDLKNLNIYSKSEDVIKRRK